MRNADWGEISVLVHCNIQSNRPYSQSWYWTETEYLQWMLMQGNIIKKTLMSFTSEKTGTASLGYTAMCWLLKTLTASCHHIKAYRDASNQPPKWVLILGDTYTRKKSESQMGFEPTTLRDLVGCSTMSYWRLWWARVKLWVLTGTILT